MNDNNSIVRHALLDAPLERVWDAIADADAFGAWFGAAFDGPFVEGARMRARIRPTQVDADVALLQQPYDGLEFVIVVQRIELMHRFSFRWHPGASAGPSTPDTQMTLVVFELDEEEAGVRLTVTESGFERLPESRRAQAIADNSSGWDMQMALIAKYLAQDG